MAAPRYQRRKEDRPAEITAAALSAFAENGYAATRVDDVAKRAGVSKGLLYLYFKTKEELFKAVVRSFVAPKIDQLSRSIDETELGAEEFIRGPFLSFIQALPDSPVKVVVRLMIAEGHKHPDLTAFYWDNIVARGLDTLRTLVARGVSNGEFRKSAIEEFPQLLVAPVMFSIVWNIVFAQHQKLDTDRLIAGNIDIMLAHLKRRTAARGQS